MRVILRDEVNLQPQGTLIAPVRPDGKFGAPFIIGHKSKYDVFHDVMLLMPNKYNDGTPRQYENYMADQKACWQRTDYCTTDFIADYNEDDLFGAFDKVDIHMLIQLLSELCINGKYEFSKEDCFTYKGGMFRNIESHN